MNECTICHAPMENVGGDWACTDGGCLNSVRHRDSRCPTCGKPPAHITQQGTGFTNYICQGGHRFERPRQPI
jgi:hypothetical protein